MHGVASPAGDDADGGTALDIGDAEWATGGVVGDGEAVGNVTRGAADGASAEVGDGATVLVQAATNAVTSRTATNCFTVTMERPAMRWTVARWPPPSVGRHWPW